MNDRLTQRVRWTALILIMGGIAGIATTPDSWRTLGLGMTACIVVAALPKTTLRSTAPMVATLVGTGAVASALNVGTVSAPVGLAVMVAITMASLLPLPMGYRSAQLIVWAALILSTITWNGIELVLSFGSLAVAWGIGHVQTESWREAWRDRHRLKQLANALSQESLHRQQAIQNRESELLNKQELMVQQERWATLGRVAVGVGHEIKNPLHAAMSSVDTARRDMDREVLDEAMHALERIHNILQDLSQFRTDNDEVEPYELGTLVHKVVSGARLGLGNLRIKVRGLPPVVVQAHRARLLQVFANLLTNAWHAVERKGHGKVMIHGAVVGDHVCIYVDDNGPGIPKGTAERIFEAFVTTKRAGKGSGLGLPVSRGMLRSMGGDLTCEPDSILGGTRMTIRLQLSAADAVPTVLPERLSPAPLRHVQRQRLSTANAARKVTHVRNLAPVDNAMLQGVVLIVDDDAAIRKAVQRTLRGHWRALIAAGSVEARQILRTEHVDVVVCDMHLSGEDALDVISVIEQNRRSLLSHLVFMSGEPTSGRLVSLAVANSDRCLGKPFPTEALLALLAKAKLGDLPLLELASDEPTPIAVIEPAWSFDLPTEEIVRDPVS